MFRSPASEFVYVRTYSRWLEDQKRRENWPETVKRYVDFVKKHLGNKIPPKVLRKIEENLLSFNVMPSMRFLWAAGDPAEQDNVTIYNCSFGTIHYADAFAEALYILMCGTGYGFSVEGKYVSQLPIVPEQIAPNGQIHEVEDHKVGWADSIKVLVNGLFAGQDIEMRYNKVRPAGARLKTMGGRASGPGPLAQLHSFVKGIFYNARGRRLTDEECHDILCEIAQIVVVGGVRRSSEISISDLNSALMQKSKTGNFPVRRYMANNSAVYYSKPDIVTFMNEWASLIASRSGERGIFNLGAARAMAPKRRNADLIVGTNPCVTGDTEILTANGYRKIEELVGKKVSVWNGFEWSEVEPKITGKNQPMVTVTFNDGRSLTCTEYHAFHVAKGYSGESYTVKAKDLDPGMKLIKHQFPVIETGIDIKDMYLQGFCSAEGMENYNFIWVYEPKESSLARLTKESGGTIKSDLKYGRYKYTHTKNLKSKTYVPFEGNIKSRLDWLSGLFDGDGTELKEGGLQLASIDRTFLSDIQKLLSTLGVQSKVVHASKARYRSMPDGHGGKKDFLCKECWRICVGAVQMQNLKKIGLSCERMKFDKNPQRDASQFITVTDITESPTEDTVFCFNEPKLHLGIFNGIITGQCAEIQLRSEEFCNLSEIVTRSEDDIDTMLEKVETATWMGIIQACFVHFPYLGPNWSKNCQEERLLGVSITGQMDAPQLCTDEALKAYKSRAIKVAKKASDTMGIPMPAAITCVKPSGCQSPDTVLITSNGILRLDEVGDIYGDKWQKHSIKVPQESGQQISTSFFVNGKAIVKKLIMDSGVTLTSTLNHKYRVLINGDYLWAESKDICEGSIIPYRIGGYVGGDYRELVAVSKPYYNVKEINQPTVLSEDLAYLLGLYFGDGSNHNKGIRIAGDVNKQRCLFKAKEIAKELFGINGTIYERTKGNNADLYLNSTYLLAYLSANGLLKQDTYNIDIPKIIRMSPTSVIESFVEGYVDADGCDTDRGVVICTVSENMAKNLPIVLRAIGKNCSVKLMPPTVSSWGSRMRYRITLTKGRDGQYLMDRKNKKYYEQLDKLGLTTLIPDRVVAIEYFESDTYDIEVPTGNTFVANSYLSHNTVSQLVDSASGLHPRFSKFYIRRYRISANDPLFRMVRDQGVPSSPENGQRKQDYVEAIRLYDAAENKIEGIKQAKAKCPIFDLDGWSKDKVNTWVVSFPVAAPKKAITVEDVTALEQLEWYKKIQKNWCEHNASITVYVKNEEWLSVGDWVYKNWDIVNGISFLPLDDSVYEQAPYEKITKEEFDKLSKTFPKIDYSQLGRYETEDNTEGAKSLACASGQCEQ
jgi:intein/homing endonuclease